MSVLYRHLREGLPLPEARKQLSHRYGHFRWTRGGILDAFFDRYLEHSSQEFVSLMRWVETAYDSEKLMSGFRAKGCSSIR
jgi:hypothetical protein